MDGCFEKDERGYPYGKLAKERVVALHARSHVKVLSRLAWRCIGRLCRRQQRNQAAAALLQINNDNDQSRSLVVYESSCCRRRCSCFCRVKGGARAATWPMTTPRQQVDASPHGSNNNWSPRSLISSQTSQDQHDNQRQNQNAALTGAARAFINGLPREELIKYVNSHSGKPQPPTKPKPYQSRRDSVESVRSNVSRQDVVVSQRPLVSRGGGSTHLLAVPQARQAVSRSPSSIAAAQAAVRTSPVAATSVSPPGIRMAKTRSPAPSIRSRAGSGPSIKSTERPDESPIPPTTSLVKLFEQRGSSTEKQKEPPVLQSPKPVRRSKILDDGLPALFPPSSQKHVHDPLFGKDVAKENQPKLTRDKHEDSDSNDSFRSAKEIASPIKVSKPPLPLPRRKNKQETLPVDDPAKPNIQLHPPSRGTSSTPMDIHGPSRSRVSSSHGLPAPHPSITATYHQLHPRRMTPLTTGDSLANAMVASSLASSRAPSPHKAPPQPATRHKSGSISHSLFSRTPSPPKKGMRHTMRSQSSSESDDEEVPYAKYKKKSKFLRKHPNKHHEGDRKRWRDAITERERKRYEGVWAANKGLHIFLTPEEQTYVDKHPHSQNAEILRETVAEQVTAVVTRDIWSRSRLPQDVLEQVWDLVDTQANGRLVKEEFVVGLWLVDQCLKGRKLPVKVSESVWSSVKFLHGIKVRKK